MATLRGKECEMYEGGPSIRVRSKDGEERQGYLTRSTWVESYELVILAIFGLQKWQFQIIGRSSSSSTKEAMRRRRPSDSHRFRS